MPPVGPIRRDRLVALLRELGFEGPFSGGNHQFMMGWGVRLHIPNPHRGDISVGLLLRLIKQGRISREEWEKL